MLTIRRFIATSSDAALKFHYSKFAPQNTEKSAILMIGWAGASPKHIEKYVKIYTDAGHHVALICPSKFHYKVPDARIGKEIAPVFGEFQEHPLLIHSFSMNGARSIVSMWKYSGAEKFESRIQGILFDSAPSRPYSWQNAFAMTLSRAGEAKLLSDKNQEKWFKVICDVRNFLLSPFLFAFPWLRPYFCSFWFLNDKMKLPKHQYVIYSTGDPISPAEHIEEFIGIQKARGNRITAVNFGDSDHVAHFRAKPDLYTATCLEFAKNV